MILVLTGEQNFPWNMNPTKLPDNKAAVAAVMNVTEKKPSEKPRMEKNLQAAAADFCLQEICCPDHQRRRG